MCDFNTTSSSSTQRSSFWFEKKHSALMNPNKFRSCLNHFIFDMLLVLWTDWINKQPAFNKATTKNVTQTSDRCHLFGSTWVLALRYVKRSNFSTQQSGSPTNHSRNWAKLLRAKPASVNISNNRIRNKGILHKSLKKVKLQQVCLSSEASKRFRQIIFIRFRFRPPWTSGETTYYFGKIGCILKNFC